MSPQFRATDMASLRSLMYMSFGAVRGHGIEVLYDTWGTHDSDSAFEPG